MAGSSPLANALTRPASQCSSKQVELSVYSARDWSQVAAYWGELEHSSPYSSFYLSVDWIAAWLEIFGELLQPQFLLFKDQDDVVGACLLMRATERRGPFRIKRIYLNTGGGNPAERTLMEFNNVLCRAGWEDAVTEGLSAHLRNLKWDEFAVEGICPGPILSSLQDKAFAGLSTELSFMPSFYVNLEQLRQENLTYENYLSANTREQLRRSMKLYGNLGEIRLEVARDLPTAERFFEQMCIMHQTRWMERGQTGVFAPGRRLEFHRGLIRRSFARGSIQMLRVLVGDTAVGVLYNFVRGSKVYFFQSGFHYQPDKHLKPGLVTHACAIRHCLGAGFHEYDFLAGDARYKRSLAKDCRQMAWVVFARPHVKLKLIKLLRSIKQRARSLRQR